MNNYLSPCKDCQDRKLGCHGKDDNKWKCVAWGRYMDAKAEAFKPQIDPMNGYAAEKRRRRHHKKHMEKRK